MGPPNSGNSGANVAGYAGMFDTALGGVTGAIGSIYGGEAQANMYNYQAGIAKLNAQINQQNATYAIQAGEKQAGMAGLQAAQRLGQIEAAQGSHGLDVNTGSPKQVQTSQKLVSQMDIAAIRTDAARTAYAYQLRSFSDVQQAGLDELAAKNARSAGMIGAASSILGSASAVSNEWLRGQSIGLWG